ncbi:hypothetical protein BC938DRAFT_475326 [Jimgerdemannia flammicorona]|uniref:Uncharacterized protein n=1 Tax=Jimgerdemannia flammicorona TaxID=994334 RepID=A0A433QRR2_9FUNG|nr:hypothetical protein BC938DRAFT_475326 [Jimgerdemannia flammicorona]
MHENIQIRRFFSHSRYARIALSLIPSPNPNLLITTPSAQTTTFPHSKSSLTNPSFICSAPTAVSSMHLSFPSSTSAAISPSFRATYSLEMASSSAA